MIDIKGNSSDPRAARLSNFTDRVFVFDGVKCAGLEGLMQALKCNDPEIQKEICALRGRDAKHRGAEHNNWKNSQKLWWLLRSYDRSGREYYDLITRAYNAVYDQDTSFRTDLVAVQYEEICHSIGKTNMRDTVLTEVEMIHQLNRLRIRVLKGRQ